MSAQAQNNTSLFNNPESNQGAQGTFHGPVYIHLARLLPKDENQPQEVDYRVRLRELLPQPDADSNPYPGLEPFDKNRYDRFFGRETLLYNLLQHLRKKPFLALLGASGSGKSSLVRAGIVPMLEAGALPGSQHWRYITIRPERHPLNKLIAGLITSERRTITGQLELWDKRSPSRTIQRVADLLGTRIVLVIDQAEELWTNAPTDPSAVATWRTEQQEPFIQSLVSILQTPEPPVSVIFTMRADFLHRAAEHAHLAQLIAENLALVSPMTTDELRTAIARPAVLAGGRFEKELVNELIAKAEQSPSTLPLLSYTLRELWNKRSDTLITWEAYRELGGVEGALAQRAEEIFLSYAPEEQPLIRKLLLRLVRPGEGTEDTRRRQSFSELAETGQTADGIQALLKRLINERLLTADRDQQGIAVVEISHEALIRAWPRLKEWLDDERDMLRFQVQLEEAAKEWQNNEQNPDLLWSGLRLRSAQEQLDISRLNERDQSFLEASRAAEQARLDAAERVRRDRVQLLQRAFLSVSSLLAVALILAMLYFRTADAERERANEAERAGRVSHAQALAANAVAQLTDDPERGILLAMEAISVTRALGEPVVPQAIEALQHALITSQVRLTLAGHTDSVIGVKYSPDNRMLATSSRDGSIKLWDAESGRESQTLQGHYYSLYDIAYQDNGLGNKQIIAVGDRQTIWQIDNNNTSAYSINSGSKYDTLTSITYRMDGKQFATSGGKTISIWNPEQTSNPVEINEENSNVFSVSYSPDGKYIVTGNEHGHVKIWNPEEGKQVMTLKGHTDRVISSKYSNDGEMIVTASWDKTVRVWRSSTGELIATLNGHTDRVRSAIYNPKDTLIASTGWDKTVIVWDSKTFKIKFKLGGYDQKLTKVIFSPNGNTISTIDEGGDLKNWDAENGREINQVHVSDSELKGVTYNNDGSQILVVGLSGYIYIVDVQTSQIKTLPGKPAPVISVSFSPDGKSILTASQDMTAKVWNIAKGSVSLTIRGHQTALLTASFSPDGKHILTGGDIGDPYPIRVWNADTGENIFSAESGIVGSHRPKYSHDGNFIVSSITKPSIDQSSYGNRDITIIDAKNGKVIKKIIASKRIFDTAFSTDGKKVAAGEEGGIIQIFDVESEKEIYNFSHHGYNSLYVSFSNDDKNIASSSVNGVSIWDLETKEKIAVYRHNVSAYTVDFSKDDKYIAVASGDNNARVWNMRAGVEGFKIIIPGSPGVDGISFDPTGGRLITLIENDDSADIWDLQQNKIIGQLKTQPLKAKGIYNAIYAPDGKHILGSDSYGSIYLWDAQSLQIIRKIEGGHAASYCNEHKAVASSLDNRGVKLWDLQTGKEVMAFNGQGITGRGVFRSLCSDDGKKVLTLSGHLGSKNYKLVIWNANTGKPENIIKLPEFSGRVIISPDGKDILAVGIGYIMIWDINSGRLKHTLKGQSGVAWGASYSKDGNYIATSNFEGLVTIWDAKTHNIIMSLPKSLKTIVNVNFHPNSRSIAVAYMDGEVQEYLVDLDDLLALARTRVLRQLTPEERSQFLGEALPSPTQQPTAVP